MQRLVNAAFAYLFSFISDCLVVRSCMPTCMKKKTHPSVASCAIPVPMLIMSVVDYLRPHLSRRIRPNVVMTHEKEHLPKKFTIHENPVNFEILSYPVTAHEFT